MHIKVFFLCNHNTSRYPAFMNGFVTFLTNKVTNSYSSFILAFSGWVVCKYETKIIFFRLWKLHHLMVNKIGDKLSHRFNITYTFTHTGTKSANFAIPEIKAPIFTLSIVCKLCVKEIYNKKLSSMYFMAISELLVTSQRKNVTMTPHV